MSTLTNEYKQAVGARREALDKVLHILYAELATCESPLVQTAMEGNLEELYGAFSVLGSPGVCRHIKLRMLGKDAMDDRSLLRVQHILSTSVAPGLSQAPARRGWGFLALFLTMLAATLLLTMGVHHRVDLEQVRASLGFAPAQCPAVAEVRRSSEKFLAAFHQDVMAKFQTNLSKVESQLAAFKARIDEAKNEAKRDVEEAKQEVKRVIADAKQEVQRDLDGMAKRGEALRKDLQETQALSQAFREDLRKSAQSLDKIHSAFEAYQELTREHMRDVHDNLTTVTAQVEDLSGEVARVNASAAAIRDRVEDAHAAFEAVRNETQELREETRVAFEQASRQTEDLSRRVTAMGSKLGSSLFGNMPNWLLAYTVVMVVAVWGMVFSRVFFGFMPSWMARFILHHRVLRWIFPFAMWYTTLFKYIAYGWLTAIMLWVTVQLAQYLSPVIWSFVKTYEIVACLFGWGVWLTQGVAWLFQ